ncbi:MAG: LamB/YcsF family protein, partial [Pseudomonadota bacterium]
MNNISSGPDQSPASTEGPSKRSSIDLNADVGEGCGDDRALAGVVSSFNIACGGHVGDPSTVRTAIELASEHGVSIGAHPSYPDPENFGRKSLSIAKETLVHSISEQIILVVETARDAGVTMKHVKPHGALYNDAAKDPALAETIAQCVATISESTPSIAGLMGPPGSALAVEAKKYNLPF